VFPENAELSRLAVPGMLWVTVAFAGTIGLSRVFDRERENDTMRALLLAPVPRLSVFLGKAAAVTVLLLSVAVVVVPMLWLLMGAKFFDHPGPLALSVLLGAIGFSVIGSLFAAGLIKVRSRDVLLPVILYPLLMPLFMAGTSICSQLLGPSPDWEKVWYWTTFLGIYDAAFLVVSLWIFESMVIE
jgi:heme exporter protein B